MGVDVRQQSVESLARGANVAIHDHEVVRSSVLSEDGIDAHSAKDKKIKVRLLQDMFLMFSQQLDPLKLHSIGTGTQTTRHRATG